MLAQLLKDVLINNVNINVKEYEEDYKDYIIPTYGYDEFNYLAYIWLNDYMGFYGDIERENIRASFDKISEYNINWNIIIQDDTCIPLILLETYYIEKMIQKGFDIHYCYVNKNITYSILTKYIYILISENRRNFMERIKWFVDKGFDINKGDTIEYISDIQYENYPHRIELIDWLYSLGLNISNRLLKNKKYLYETPIGNILSKLNDNKLTSGVINDNIK